MKASSLSPRAGTVHRSFPRGWPDVVLWHRDAEGRAGWSGGSPHTPFQLTRKPQGRRGGGYNYMGWNLASPLGWNGTAAPAPALCARLEEFTHRLQQTCKASEASVIGPPEPTIKEIGLCLLIKLEPQRTRRLSILTPHLKKMRELSPMQWSCLYKVMQPRGRAFGARFQKFQVLSSWCSPFP